MERSLVQLLASPLGSRSALPMVSPWGSSKILEHLLVQLSGCLWLKQFVGQLALPSERLFGCLEMVDNSPYREVVALLVEQRLELWKSMVEESR